MSDKPAEEPIKPSEVLAQVADALPEQLRGNVIIVGSIAALRQAAEGRTAAVSIVPCPDFRTPCIVANT